MWRVESQNAVCLFQIRKKWQVAVELITVHNYGLKFGPRFSLKLNADLHKECRNKKKIKIFNLELMTGCVDIVSMWIQWPSSSIGLLWNNEDFNCVTYLYKSIAFYLSGLSAGDLGNIRAFSNFLIVFCIINALQIDCLCIRFDSNTYY